MHRRFRSGSTLLGCLAVAALAAGIVIAREPAAAGAGQVTPAGDGTEVHLANIRQLTFGGENAEAYFSHEGTEIIFQSTREGVPCDQIFRMDLDGSNQQMVSTGKGPHHVRLLLSGGRRHRLRVDPPRGGRVPAAAELPDGLRVGHLRHVRHLPRRARRQRAHPPDRRAGLRRRADDRSRRPHRLHERAGRRHGDLLDERRRHGRQATDAPAGAGRGGRSTRPTGRRSSSAAERFPTVRSTTTSSGCSRRGCGGRPRSRSSSWTPTAATCGR